MKKIIAAGMLVAGFTVVGLAQAQVALTASAGTTGVGLHMSTSIQQNLNARVGVNGINYSFSGNTSDVDYDFKLKVNTFDALLDFFPGASEFRLTAGLAYNNNKVNAHGVSNNQGTYTINGQTYNAASLGTLDGQVRFRRIAPYLGIGYGNALAVEKGWSFSTDLGVYFQGSPSTSLSNSNCNLPTSAQCALLATNVDAENAKLRDKVKDYKYYPVLRVGVSYRF